MTFLAVSAWAAETDKIKAKATNSGRNLGLHFKLDHFFLPNLLIDAAKFEPSS